MFTTKSPDETKSKAKKMEPSVAQAPSPSHLPTQQSSVTQTPNAKKTMIYVRYNVGFPNTLFIRGKGANLSWTKGIPLKNLQADLWVFETDTPFSQAEFKILINDQAYEEGENRTIQSGNHIEFSPRFRR